MQTIDPGPKYLSLVKHISKSFAVNEFLDIHVWIEVIIFSIQSSECFETYRLKNQKIFKKKT